MPQDLNMDVLKFLQRSKTRWLSSSACMRCILNLFLALKEYFLKQYNALKNKKLSMAETNAKNELKYIVDLLFNPLTEMYIGFLSYILPIICTLNIEFQAEGAATAYNHVKLYQ